MAGLVIYLMDVLNWKDDAIITNIEVDLKKKKTFVYHVKAHVRVNTQNR